MISILIPTYNDECLELVEALQTQAEAFTGFAFEVVVADDGSSDLSVKERNRAIRDRRNCRLIEFDHNTGRAAIRNLLAREARGEWLLFIDADMKVADSDYLRRYAEAATRLDGIVYGGYEVAEGPKGNLRFRYEKAAEPLHTVAERRKQPYRDFHTSNFMIQRQLMLAHPFDERFRNYGYEDVFFGKVMRGLGVAIHHIDAPVVFCRFESNEAFINKTEEGLRTLRQFSQELEGYSSVLVWARRLHRIRLTGAIHRFFRNYGSAMKRRLCQPSPSILLFKIYKLCYYLSLDK